MWTSIGFRKTLKTVVNFPAIILTPAFSYWVFGPIESLSCPTGCRGSNSRLGASFLRPSFLHTWINVGLTLLGQVIFVLIVDLSKTDHTKGFLFVSLPIMLGQSPSTGTSSTIFSIPLHILGIIMLILLQFLEKCNCCTSSCCESITHPTLLNVDNPLEKIKFQQRVNEEEHEMQIIQI